ncbi:MAG: aminoacyl-tRNA hydrolase, partial [Holophagales bacterium]|nr:aminoacyl-tRNA hydrolase [Holophagales bacterium]
GQNVNKLATRVTVRFDVDASPSLDEAQKARIHERLGSRISKDGVLAVSSQAERSQRLNLEKARGRLAELLQDALEVPRERRETRPTRRSRQRRLANKRHRSRVKQLRGRPSRDE